MLLDFHAAKETVFTISCSLDCFFAKKHNILCFSIDRTTNYVIMGSTKRDKIPIVVQK